MDEYDSIMSKNPYFVNSGVISGLWSLKKHKVIAFSATSFKHVERLVNNCITKPRVLNFSSEYEVCNGANPVQYGNFVPCPTEQSLLINFEAEICKNYDAKPLVVIYEEEQYEAIKFILKKNKFIFYYGTSSQTLFTIKEQSHGVLLLEKSECRGVDVRFAKDARVVITAEPEDYNEYLQMLGRASRTRGVCEGVMLTRGNEKASQIIQRLKNSNVASMLELERLVQLLEDKVKDKHLIAKLEQL